MVDAPRRDRLNVALEGLLSHVSRAASGRGTILNGRVREGAKRWGRGDEGLSAPFKLWNEVPGG